MCLLPKRILTSHCPGRCGRWCRVARASRSKGAMRKPWSFNPKPRTSSPATTMSVRYSNVFLGELRFKKGERLERGGLVVEILDLDAAKLPSRVAFRFNASLDSPAFHWLQFNYQTRSYEPFAVPSVGQRVTVFGPFR